MGEATVLCAHITDILVEPDAEENVISRYRTVVTWNVNRSQSVKNPAKRRKVNSMSDIMELL